MFKKSFFLILIILGLLFCLLFFTACSAPGEPGAHPDFGSFIGGTTGLKVGVLEGAPPDIIISRGLSRFSVVAVLENAGEAEVGPGTDNPLVVVRLAGIMYPDFGLTESTGVKTLDAGLAPARKNLDGSIMSGEVAHVSFDNLVYKPAFDGISLPLVVETCYDYETYATTKICIKKDVLEAYEDASICTLVGPKPVAGSAAPVSVTRVDELPVSENSVQINFVIEHVGSGVFFSRHQYQDLFDVCVIDDANPFIYQLEVFIEPVQDNIYEIDCFRLDNDLPGGGVSGVVSMFQGAPLTISCFLSRTSPVDVRIYEDLLDIKLRYRYVDVMEIPVTIQNYPQ
ncbi:hypothetical protein KY348_01920 [Candidatus Woesearchaeota archaeon]|nr:hypothetical protein [Candidatus Woesearchaeota archaeon]